MSERPLNEVCLEHTLFLHCYALVPVESENTGRPLFGYARYQTINEYDYS
jgi:hypothetical protein